MVDRIDPGTPRSLWARIARSAIRVRGDFALVLLDLVLTVFTYLLLFALRFDFSVPAHYWDNFQIFLPVACLVSWAACGRGAATAAPGATPASTKPCDCSRPALCTGVRPRRCPSCGAPSASPSPCWSSGRSSPPSCSAWCGSSSALFAFRRELVHEHRRARRGRRRGNQRRRGAARDAADSHPRPGAGGRGRRRPRRSGTARCTACRSPGRSTTSRRIVDDHDVHLILLAMPVGPAAVVAARRRRRRGGRASRCASLRESSSLGARHATPARDQRPEHRGPARAPSRSTSTSNRCASCCTDAGCSSRAAAAGSARRSPARSPEFGPVATGAPRPRRDPPPRHGVRPAGHRRSPRSSSPTSATRRRSTRCSGAVRPEVVFHAAAHKHVADPRGLRVRGRPHQRVRHAQRDRRLCNGVGVAQLVCISTDKAATPTSVMGASKWLAEQIVLERADARRLLLGAVRQRAREPRQRDPHVPDARSPQAAR